VTPHHWVFSDVSRRYNGFIFQGLKCPASNIGHFGPWR